MTSYYFSQIKQSDKWAQNQHSALLSEAGLSSDQPADFALGIYDENYDLIATGSLLDDQLHSIAVSEPYRGKGLLCQIVSHLYEHRFQSGSCALYVTVQDELAPMFQSLGFHEIKKICEDVVYMGNHHGVQLYQQS